MLTRRDAPDAAEGRVAVAGDAAALASPAAPAPLAADGAAPLVGVPEDPGPPGGSPEQRGIARQGVLWAAKLDTGDAVIDCIVLDISIRGARVRFGAPVAVPERVVLRLRDGTRLDAWRRWSRGTQLGLEFVGAGVALSPSETMQRRVRDILEAVQATDPKRWLPMLRGDRFFGDESLRQAAEAAEIAHARLQAALRAHAGIPAG